MILTEDAFIFFNLLLLKSLERLTNKARPKDDEKRNKISDNDLERKYEPVSFSVRKEKTIIVRPWCDNEFNIFTIYINKEKFKYFSMYSLLG